MLRGALDELFVAEFIGFERFIVNLVEGRDAVVPFEQRGGGANEFDGVGIHLPYRVENGMIVRIEKVLFELRVARNMDLPDPMMRNVVEVVVRVEVVVFRRDVNVVYVQQYPAVGQFDHFAQELPLRHF